MKILFIIQCIDTFGFVPAEDKLRFFADGRRFYPVCKSIGYYIASSELPEEFVLSISSDIYYDREIPVRLEAGMIRVNLIRKSPPPRKRAAFISTGEYVRAALEYGYFYLGKSAERADKHITAENPYRFCLEGRSFVLLDTSSGLEEFIVLEKAENNLMTDYLTRELANDYNAEFSVLLPAFELYVKAKIPIEMPPGGAAEIRLYGADGKKAVRIRADSLFS